MNETEEKEVEVTSEITRYGSLPLPMKIVFSIFCAVGLILSFMFVFNIPIGGYTLLNFSYYLLFIALYSSSVFLILPARKKDRNRVPWFDYLAFLLTIGVSIYFYMNSEEMSMAGWYDIPWGWGWFGGTDTERTRTEPNRKTEPKRGVIGGT